MAKRKFAKLKNLIFERELTQEEIAKAIGRGEAYIGRRMNGYKPFNTVEIKAIGEMLEIPREAWLDYFMEDNPNGSRNQNQHNPNA